MSRIVLPPVNYRTTRSKGLASLGIAAWIAAAVFIAHIAFGGK